MSTTLTPRLRADLEEILAGYERRVLTQADIDRLPSPVYGGGLTYGRGDARGLTRCEALRILRIVWAGAAVALALVALGSWLR
jgi:hypothetical protein